MFAYEIHAELNNDGTYRVRLIDMDAEYPEITTIDRASILIEQVSDTLIDSSRPLLTVKLKGAYCSEDP